MSNIAIAQQSALVIPEQFSGVFSNFASAFSNFSGSTFRSISVRGSRFSLVEGGVTTPLPGESLYAVILGMAPDMHCSLYKGQWSQDMSEEDQVPLAVWYSKSGAPESIPKAHLAKDANGRNPYSTHQRLVVAIAKQTQNGAFIDFDTPYILDVAAMGIFGEDKGTPTMLNLSEYVRLLERNKTLPCQVITQITFQPLASVPTLRFIAPMNSEGVLGHLPQQELVKAYAAAMSQEVQNLQQVQLLTPEQREERIAEKRTKKSSPKEVAAPAPVNEPASAPVNEPIPVEAPAPDLVKEPAPAGGEDMATALQGLLQKAGAFKG